MTGHDLTVQELAELIAIAARNYRGTDLSWPVLQVLFEHDSWFCRVWEDDQGTTQDTRLPGQQEFAEWLKS